MPPPLGARERRSLLALARTLVDRRAARVRIFEDGSRLAERTLDVLAIAWDRPRWTVATWCREEEALRVLDVGRIRSVRATRCPATAGPEAFDRDAYTLRPYLDPEAGPPVPVTATVDRRWGRVARALFPTSRVDPLPGGGWACRLLATRPEVVDEMAGSLALPGAIDSQPAMPTPAKTKAKSLEARLLALAEHLAQQSEPVTRAQIFEQFPADYAGQPDAAEKKFTRDKDAIRRLGFVLDVVELGNREEQFGYRVDAHGSKLPPLEFSPDEAAVLWTAGLDALRASDHPLRDDLESALRKLFVGTRGLPPRAATTAALPPDPPPEELPELLERLIGAWESRKRIAIDYLRVGDGSVSSREVDVYGWASRRGEWIFVGHCHLRKAVRIFYLSRVRAMKVNARKVAGRPSKESDYDVPDGFDIRRWSRQQVWDYDVHEPRGACVRFRGSLAPLARQLLPGAKVATETTGARVARLEVRNLRGLVRQALAWGPEAELAEPEEGRRMAAEILDGLADATRGTP